METYIIRGKQYTVRRHYGNYEPVFVFSPDGEYIRVEREPTKKGRNLILSERNRLSEECEDA